MPLELPDRQKRMIRRRRFGTAVTVPPFDTAHAVWAFDPDGVGGSQNLLGPSGTVTTPVKTQGAPSYYTFGASDFIDFGDSLDTTWTSGVGFTIYLCLKPSAADLAASNVAVINKIATSNDEIELILVTNQLQFYTFFGGGVTNFVTYNSNASVLTAGARSVVAITFDPTQLPANRVVMYVNSSNVFASRVVTGVDGTIANTTSTLRLGVRSGLTATVSVQSYAYAYNAVHSAGTVASITSWLQNTKGWK